MAVSLAVCGLSIKVLQRACQLRGSAKIRGFLRKYALRARCLDMSGRVRCPLEVSARSGLDDREAQFSILRQGFFRDIGVRDQAIDVRERTDDVGRGRADFFGAGEYVRFGCAR